MNFKESLIRAREDSPAAITEFLQTEFDSSSIIAFVEGRDDVDFYFGLLQGKFDDIDIIFLRCGNKDGVIKAHSNLKSRNRLRGARAFLFIVDQDFDFFHPRNLTDDIFVTDFYSIESYLIDQTFVDYCLGKHCGATRVRSRKLIADRILNRYEKIARNCVFLFACMLVCRITNIDCRFDKIILSNILERDDATGEFRLSHQTDALFALFEIKVDDRPRVFEFAEQMEAVDCRLWTRGKHGWQIMKFACQVDEIDKDAAERLRNWFSRAGLKEFSASGANVPSFDAYFERVDGLNQCA